MWDDEESMREVQSVGTITGGHTWCKAGADWRARPGRAQKAADRWGLTSAGGVHEPGSVDVHTHGGAVAAAGARGGQARFGQLERHPAEAVALFMLGLEAPLSRDHMTTGLPAGHLSKCQ